MLPPLDPPLGVTLVALAAHPDDETLGAGGLIARVARSGGSVRVVVASDGEASHPQSPTTPAHRLAGRRRQEVTSALRRLGAPPPRLLGHPDGGLAGHVDAIAAALDEEVAAAATVVWIAAPWREDRHPDHEAAGAAAARVARQHRAVLLEYPVWAWEWDTPGGSLRRAGLRALRLDGQDLGDKQAAMALHVSQVAPLSTLPGDEAVVPDRVADHFRRDVEAYIVTDGWSGRGNTASLPAAYFDTLYDGARGRAPWGLDGGWYEQRKRALLLSALPSERYDLAVEPGCAVGLLTVELAARCRNVVAIDVSAEAVRATRERVAGADQLGTVDVRQGAIPDGWPILDRSPDLVVLSEVGYYLDTADWDATVALVVGSLAPGGHVVACHWRHAAPGYPATADQVHAALRRQGGLTLLSRHEEEDFLLDVLGAPGSGSVARRQGLLG
jgi:LmbE family N-acetylglucosaminyl deacetylase/SAM-dependent methyltransferase